MPSFFPSAAPPRQCASLTLAAAALQTCSAAAAQQLVLGEPRSWVEQFSQ